MPARRYQRRTRSLADRFWPKVRMTHTCWIWTAATNTGYGVIGGPRDEPNRVAHRVAYELLVGPIPEGLQLDHLCRNSGAPPVSASVPPTTGRPGRPREVSK